MQFLTTTSEGYISLFFTLALMLVLLYFMIYRPQKKQEKKDAAMRSSLEIGDQVTTIGGVIGRVVAIKDDTFVLETGADRVKIRFTKSAISSVEKLNMDKAPADKKTAFTPCIHEPPPCIDYVQGGGFVMSESRGFPAELLSFLLFGVLGVAVTAAALACFAQLMAGQGCSGSVVPILATTAVCMGSLLCALTAAFRKKARGLLTGLLQSTFLAVPLALSAIWNGTAAEPAVVCRLLAVLLCGCIGGLLGVTLRSRRHTLR